MGIETANAIPLNGREFDRRYDAIEQLIFLAKGLGLDVNLTRSLEQQPVSDLQDEHKDRCLKVAESLQSPRDFVNQNEFMEWYRDRLKRSRAVLSILGIRERQVTIFVGHGYPNKQIASILRVSEKTVEKYRASACRKLRMPTAAEVSHLLAAADLFVGYRTECSYQA